MTTIEKSRKMIAFIDKRMEGKKNDVQFKLYWNPALVILSTIVMGCNYSKEDLELVNRKLRSVWENYKYD